MNKETEVNKKSGKQNKGKAIDPETIPSKSKKSAWNAELTKLVKAVPDQTKKKLIRAIQAYPPLWDQGH